jgi:ABC-type spermidine/putrescine transport system permease subunit II/imidazolonepropionase-like amidohydrolase
MSQLLFRNFQLLEPEIGALQGGHELLVEGDTVREVSGKPIKAEKADVIDCGGRTLMPGLIDSHVHVTLSEVNFRYLESIPLTLMTARAARLMLGMINRGFTTVRDTGGADWGLKTAVEQGDIPGPRLFIAGAAIGPTGGHSDPRRRTDFGMRCHCCDAMRFGMRQSDGVSEMLKATREQMRQGVDHIKIMMSGGVASPYDPLDSLQFSPQEVAAAVQEANAFGRYVCAHAYTPEAITRAAHGGVRVIEHGNLINDATAKLMAEKGMFMVANLVAYYAMKERAAEYGMSGDMLAKNDLVIDGGLLQAGRRSGRLRHRPPRRAAGRGKPRIHDSQRGSVPARDHPLRHHHRRADHPPGRQARYAQGRRVRRPAVDRRRSAQEPRAVPGARQASRRHHEGRQVPQEQAELTMSVLVQDQSAALAGLPRRRAPLGRWALNGAAGVSLGFILLPLVLVTWLAFFRQEIPSFPPEGYSLQWFGAVMNNKSFVNGFILSSQVGVAATLIGVVIALPASLAIARRRFFGRGIVNALMLMPLIVPGVVLGTSIYVFQIEAEIATGVQMLGSTAGLIAAHALVVIPWAARLVSASLASFDPAIEEAAKNLGAGPWTTFYRVTLPSIRPGIVAGALFGFVTSFGNLEMSLFLVGPGSTTLPIAILQYLEWKIDPTVAAVSVMQIVLIGVAMLITDRYVKISRVV